MRRRVQTTTVYISGGFGFAMVRITTVYIKNSFPVFDTRLLTLEHGDAYIS